MTTRDDKKVPGRSRKTQRDGATVAPMRRQSPPPEREPAAPRAPIGEHERTKLIAEQAYLIAEARGFEPGHELEDWLSAEHAVDERLASAPKS